jgi:phospholipid transport system transporter-binding protein
MAMVTLPSQLTLREATAELATLTAAIASSAEPEIELDAALLVQIDSAALAVLLGCVRAAQARQRRVVVRHAPPRLRHLALLYGVQDLLGLQEPVSA